MNYQPMMPVTSPKARIVFGVGIICFGVLGWFAPDLERLWYWMLGIVLFGGAMIGSALRQQAYEAQVRSDVERAEREWPDLVRDAKLARRQGGSIARLLQQSGYREHFLRHWLAGRLEQELDS
ncbi:MAG: hypothetical protein JNM25_11945 [Planctomycetes bacterium]|nr:hypothetical protein [Planctomycetota bacterium]